MLHSCAKEIVEDISRVNELLTVFPLLKKSTFKSLHESIKESEKDLFAVVRITGGMSCSAAVELDRDNVTFADLRSRLMDELVSRTASAQCMICNERCMHRRVIHVS